MSSRFSTLVASAAAMVSVIVAVSLTATSAHAQDAAPAAAPGGLAQYGMLIPMLFAFVVIMVMQSFKQKKQRTERDAFLSKLDRGEEVITTGGILGTIAGLTDLYLTLEIAPGTRIKVLRSSVVGLAKNVAPAATEVKA